MSTTATLSMLPSNRHNKIVPGKRLRNWHRAYNARATEPWLKVSLKAYARMMIASDDKRSSAVAEAWLDSK